MREADRRATAAALRRSTKSTGEPEGARGSPAADGEAAEPQGEEPEQKAPKLSDSLLRRLAAHRTLALQAVLASNVSLALAALTHVFVKAAFSEAWPRDRSAMQVTIQSPANALAALADDLQSSRASHALEAAMLRWKERLPEQRSEWFAWLAELPQDELLQLLALCAALTVNTLPVAGATADANALASAAALDMADWWEPTAASYLNHVSKVQIVEAVKEAVGDGAASQSLFMLKKQGLVAEATLWLAGKRWLPQVLRQTA